MYRDFVPESARRYLSGAFESPSSATPPYIPPEPVDAAPSQVDELPPLLPRRQPRLLQAVIDDLKVNHPAGRPLETKKVLAKAVAERLRVEKVSASTIDRAMRKVWPNG
jgi:hypothetical protein